MERTVDGRCRGAERGRALCARGVVDWVGVARGGRWGLCVGGGDGGKLRVDD